MAISVLVFTLNEEKNLPSCLDGVAWSDDVHVVDSFSTDATLQVCEDRGVRAVQNQFRGFGAQRNWALDNIETRHPWVLILDADERVSRALSDEMLRKVMQESDGIAAYRMRRRFYLWGKWLKYSSLYPTWVVRLVRKDRVRFVNRGHAEAQAVNGEIGTLTNDLIDENAKGIDAWFERQNRYSTHDAQYELSHHDLSSAVGDMLSKDPLVRRAAVKRFAWRLPGRPLWYFLYSYAWRRGFLDGKQGLMYCGMRALYQGMVSIKKYDLRKTNTRQ